ncbi:MAG TPA: hypothetical protein VJS64_15270 [Pyrinomonadaceae bacterium]|nr:hypothetical protein [Pyrinomonadaceae bacterium]
MSSFDFQVKGLTRNELNRRTEKRRQSRAQITSGRTRFPFVNRFWIAPSPGAHIALTAALVFGGVYSMHWIYTTVENDSRSVFRRLAHAQEVIVLPDQSGSMSDKQARLQALIDRLKQRNIDTDNQFATDGGGFSSQGPDNNSLHRLETALQAHPGADAIFVFSDFSSSDYGADVHDDAGLNRLRQLVTEQPRRLYLGTVAELPPERLVAIARQSGGGLIEIVP